jgi:hypothetical protein
MTHHSNKCLGPRTDVGDPADGVGRYHEVVVLISDAHGYPQVIEKALEHSGFREGVDDFIFCGDFLDRGPDPQGCLELIERHATEVLIGNHELAILLDFEMWPQDAVSWSFRPLLIDKVLNAPPDKAWKLAACVEGVLATHAGLSSRYEKILAEECGGDPALLAAWLNEDFVAAVKRKLETGEWDRDGILGDDGPLWFRPTQWSSVEPLAGVRQVSGHSVPRPELEADGFYMIDPCAWMSLGGPELVRYAVIEEGSVRVEEGHWVDQPL